METGIFWAAAAFSAFLIWLNLNGWRNTLRVYHGVAFQNFVETARIMRGSWLFVTVVSTSLVLILFLLFVPFYQRFFPAPLLFLVGVVFADNISRRIMPPAVLLLCASTQIGAGIARDLKRGLMTEFFGGLRIGMLLDARVSGLFALEYFYNVGTDNLRQRWGLDWTIAVSRLMQITPSIVIDLRYETDAMRVELDLLKELKLERKALFLLEPSRLESYREIPRHCVVTQTCDLLRRVAQRLKRI